MSDLTDLLRETFPGWEGYPPTCWVRLAVEEEQSDFSDVVREISLASLRDDLMTRVAQQHPEREHRDDHDDQVLSVFSEALGLAWALQSADYNEPRFSWQEGTPDIRCAGSSWIEVKSMRHSDNDAKQQRLADVRDPVFASRLSCVDPTLNPGFMMKLNSYGADALKKAGRVEGSVTLFLNVEGFDLSTPRSAARAAIRSWGKQFRVETGLRVAYCWNYRWTETELL